MTGSDRPPAGGTQRILQRGEIEALDRIDFPRIRLPDPDGLLADRAARLRSLAIGNPIGDYLAFVADLVDGQRVLLPTLRSAPPTAADTVARAHAMPVLPIDRQLDAGWQAALDGLITSLRSSGDATLPPPLLDGLARLQAMPPDARLAMARRVLAEAAPPPERSLAPILMAALQAVTIARASRLVASEVSDGLPTAVCPVCGSAPVASVLRIGGNLAGHRYLHCAMCATEWHAVRVKCTHCDSTAGIRYRGIERTAPDGEAGAVRSPGGSPGGAVLAETCDSCRHYRKIVSQEKDPSVEPLADDLATLMLDLLMSETEFARASGNPLLVMGDAGPGG